MPIYKKRLKKICEEWEQRAKDGGYGDASRPSDLKKGRKKMDAKECQFMADTIRGFDVRKRYRKKIYLWAFTFATIEFFFLIYLGFFIIENFLVVKG